jgi:hypothetical protein
MLIMPYKPMRLNTIISVCCLKDIETWGITSDFIVQNIKANQYKVIVPDHEIADFVKISPPQFEVIGESRYTNQFRSQLLEMLPDSKKDQFGWYLQQFIKLLAVADNNLTDIILIWDADTAPITSLDFIDSSGRLLYYKSDEHHQPYFDTIKKLLNLDKRVNFSFIAQCFVIKVTWIQELFLEIETKHKMPWLDALLGHIDFNEGNGFSEYETLGTFISYKHPDEVLYIDRPWWRLGNSLINHIAFLSKRRAQELASSYDFISFEKWERAKPYFWKVTVPYFFKISLPKVINKIFS